MPARLGPASTPELQTGQSDFRGHILAESAGSCDAGWNSQDPHLTPELGRFNLEFDCDPLELRGDCLTRLENQLNRSMADVAALAERHGAAVLLTGILPSVEGMNSNHRGHFPA